LWLLENESEEDLRAELKWLRHNQAALDARLQRVEDSLIFRSLRSLGTFYQSYFRNDAFVPARAYEDWAARHSRRVLSPDPGWSYQPLITVVSAGADLASLHAQTYTNWELDGSRGEYIAAMRPGAVLAPDALARAVAAMQECKPGCTYFDHEIAGDAGQPVRPVFKPDWSPVLLESCDYRGDFHLQSREPRSGGVHVPHIAYSSRSTLRFRKADPVPTRTPLVSVVICSRNADLLSRCLTAFRSKTDYGSSEIVVIHHTGSADDDRIIQITQDCGALRVPYSGPFNFAEMNNRASRSAQGDILLFLNDDVEPLDSRWLDRMVARLERPETGAVGAKLLYPNGTIQHAGIVTWEMDGAGHPGRFMTGSEFWPWLDAAREVTAVTGACLAIRRTDFLSVGGFDPVFPVNFNDVDLCLRLQERGLAVILETSAVLQHDEGRTRARGVGFEERRKFFLRWHARVERTDPFYSPHLVQNNENLTLRE
jgi:O-antigen biosynthesis protein